MKPVNTQRIFHYLHFLFLPLALALLFAIQNQAFNNWLGLIAKQYSLRLFFASFALGLIIYSPSLFFKKWARYMYLFLASFFTSFIFLAQFLYFEYGQSFVQVSALRYAGQATSITGTIIDLLSLKLLFFITNIFIVAIAYVVTFKKEYQELVVSKKEKIALFFLLLVVAFAGYYFLIRQEKQEWGNSSRLYKDVYDLNTLVEKVGIMNFTLEDAVKFVSHANMVSAQDKSFLASFAKSQTVATVKNPKYFGLDKNKNIIFLQIESLENAVINQHVDGQEITPNLNLLASGGLYFPNYYTQVGPGNTADAEFSTLNSLYPLQDDVVFTDYAQNSLKALPSTLVKNKYHTYAMHGDVPTFWNRSNVYPALGYQDQISEGDYVMTRPVGHGPSPLGDEDFLNQSLPKMQSFKQPFMATLITISSHTPFELPQDLQTLDLSNETDFNYTQQQYLQSVHYADKAIGEFIAGLKKSGLYDNSVIFIYGDHESFTDISKPLGVGNKNLPVLADSQVPLIVLNSGIKGVDSNPASHIDLYPTILNLLGIQSLPGMFGQDMFNTKTPLVTRRNIFSGTISEILTDTMAFKTNSDGVFEQGTCWKIPEQTLLPIGDCRDVYNQQVNTVRASDIIVRGNLLDYYVSHLSK